MGRDSQTQGVRFSEKTGWFRAKGAKGRKADLGSGKPESRDRRRFRAKGARDAKIEERRIFENLWVRMRGFIF
jgi:hypothetical protein